SDGQCGQLVPSLCYEPLPRSVSEFPSAKCRTGRKSSACLSPVCSWPPPPGPTRCTASPCTASRSSSRALLTSPTSTQPPPREADHARGCPLQPCSVEGQRLALSPFALRQGLECGEDRSQRRALHVCGGRRPGNPAHPGADADPAAP